MIVTSARVQRWLEEGKEVTLVWRFADGDETSLGFTPGKTLSVGWGCPETHSWAKKVVAQVTGEQPDLCGYDGADLPLPTREWKLEVDEVELYDGENFVFLPEDEDPALGG